MIRIQLRKAFELLPRVKPIQLRFSSSESSDGNGNNDDSRRKNNKQRTARRIAHSQKAIKAFEFTQKQKVPVLYPQVLAVPLSKRPLFPGFYKSMFIKEPQAIQAIQALWSQKKPYIGIFLAKNENTERDIVSAVDEVEKVGVFAEITNIFQASQDNTALTVVVFPHRRISLNSIDVPGVKNITNETEESPNDNDNSLAKIPKKPDFDLDYLGIPIANVENLVEHPYDQENTKMKALKNEIINTLKEISKINPLLRDQIIALSAQTINLVVEPSKLADFAAAVSSGEPSELQGILETLDIEERLNRSLVVLKKELANCRLQQEISKEVDQKIGRKQQQYFLMEQLKGIKKQLGMEGDGKEKLIERFQEKAKKLVMPEQVREVFDDVYLQSYF